MAINHQHVACSPEAVFAVLADGWLYPTWVVGASRIRNVEPAWPQVDSEIHHSFGVWPLLINDSTSSLEWDPPRRAVFKARGWPMGAARVILEVEPGPGGSVITIEEDAVEGPGLLMPKPVRDALIHARNRETLRRLGFLAEGRGATG